MNKRITTQEELQETGAYAWPGGYPIIYIGSEGATLCFECAGKSLGGEDPTLTAVNGGDYEPEQCDGCGKIIGEPEEEDPRHNNDLYFDRKTGRWATIPE